MVFTIILILFIGLLLYLLFAPIIMVVDTRSDEYFLQLKGLLKASVLADEIDVLKIHLRILFFDFHFYPLRPRADEKPKEKTANRLKQKTRRKVNFKTILRLLRSFKITSFYLNIDTGNCITNARLYPIFAFLDFYKGGFKINFTGQNTLVLVVENKPVRLIRSYINI
jgi:hypothetical protein